MLRNRFFGRLKKRLVAIAVAPMLVGSVAPFCFSQSQDEPVLQIGHAFSFFYGSRVTAIAFTPDNQFVITGGKEGAIKIWRRDTGQLLRTIPAYAERVTTLSVSPNSAAFLAGTSNSQIDLWNLSTGQKLRSFSNQAGTYVNELVFSPDDQTFVSHTNPEHGPVSLRLWEVNTGTLLKVFDMQGISDPNTFIGHMAFSPLGDTLAAHSVKINSGTSVLIWSISSGKLLKKISPQKSATFMAYSPDGRRIALAASNGEELSIVNVENSQVVRSIAIRDTRQIAISRDWRYFATSGQAVNLWSLDTGTVLRTQNYEGYEEPKLAFSEDGELLAITYGSSLKLLSTSSNGILPQFGYPADFTTGIALSPDGKRFAWGSKDLIYVWDLSRDTLLHVLKGHSTQVNEIAFSPDGNTLASCSDAEIKLWSVTGGSFIKNLEYGKEYDEYNWSQTIAYSPDGRLIASGFGSMGEAGSESIGVKLWNARTGRLLKVLKIPGKASEARIPLGPSRRLELHHSENNYSLPRGISFFVPGGTSVETRSVAFSPDGKLIASGDGFNVVRLWKVTTGRLIQNLEGHADSVNSVAFSPDGKRLVSGGFDAVVKVWDVRSRRNILSLSGHVGRVSSVRFSNDGKIIISAGYDHSIKIWDSTTGELKGNLEDHVGAVTSLAVNPREPVLFSASLDGKIDVWSLSRSQLLSSIVATPNAAWLNFSPDGYYAGSKDGESYLAWRRGNELLPTSAEFRARFLRPDAILERLHDKSAPTVAVASSPVVQPKPMDSRLLVQPEPIKALPPRSKRWALIIGVDKYEDGNITSLEGATNDADAIAKALKDYAGFDENQIILLTNQQDKSRQPTRRNILKFISTLTASAAKDGGLLLISFSGHGVERNRRAFLIPSDAIYTDDVSLLQDTAVSVERIKQNIKDAVVPQVIVLLDACRNDPVNGRAESINPLTEEFVHAFDFDVRNRDVQAFATIYATSVGARAYEDARKKEGYFTVALVEALGGKAADPKTGEVTLASLIDYIQKVVPIRIATDLGQGKQQRPFAMVDGYRYNELVIAARKQ